MQTSVRNAVSKPRAQRFVLHCPVESPRGTARTRNISASGMLMEASPGEWPSRPVAGETLEVRLRLDQSGAAFTAEVHATTCVVRSERDADGCNLLIAARFIDLRFC